MSKQEKKLVFIYLIFVPVVAGVCSCVSLEHPPAIKETSSVPYAGLFALSVIMGLIVYAWNKFNEPIE